MKLVWRNVRESVFPLKFYYLAMSTFYSCLVYSSSHTPNVSFPSYSHVTDEEANLE